MDSGKVLVGLSNRCFILRLEGDVRVPWCVSLENYCETVITTTEVDEVRVDLGGAVNCDSTTLGVLAKLAMMTVKHCSNKARLYVRDQDLLRLVESMAFDQVFTIESDPFDDEIQMADLPYIDCSELEAKDTVIGAHKVLMDLSEDNRKAFLSLVSALEAQCHCLLGTNIDPLCPHGH